MTSFYPESGPGMPFAICPERMCLTEQIPLGSAPSVLLHGGPRMCPVLEITEGLCVYHGSIEVWGAIDIRLPDPGT